MGDWAQGEFQVAGEVAGTDYTCLPGLGDNEIISADGDAFYFPLLDDEEQSKAQEALASMMFNAGDAGRLQPQEGLAADPQGRRPRRGQRLHEEGPRDPRGGEHHQVDRHDAHARTRRRRRTTLFTEFFADPSITARGRPGAVRRDHRQRRLRRPDPTGRRTRSGGRPSSADRGEAPHVRPSEPALPQPQREDRLDPDDPDRRRRLPRRHDLDRRLLLHQLAAAAAAALRRPRPVRAAMEQQPLAGLDREPRRSTAS